MFEIAKGSTTITTLARLDTSDGLTPDSLTIDAAGNLYGTTPGDGNNDHGAVFEVAKGSGTATMLVRFDGSNGDSPGDLVVDAAGNLYGTTDHLTVGGVFPYAPEVFEVVKGSGAATALATFDGADLDTANSLVVDPAGNLYGTTSGGGAADPDGGIFEIARGSGSATTLASFDGTDGSSPNDLVMDAAGNLYGTTVPGGTGNAGTVFELAKGARTISAVASLTGGGARKPYP